MEDSENIYLVGDVRYSAIAFALYDDDKHKKKFLQKLQKLMEEYGVIKIDISMDALIISCRSQ